MKYRYFFLAICGSILTPSYGSETLGTLPDSATALGMSGGRYANLKDPSALHSTPANIADFTRTEAQLNYQLWYGDITFKQAQSGESISMRDPWKMLGSFHFVQPIIPGKLVFGLGVTAPFGLDSQWPKEGPLRYLIPYEATLVTFDINPVIAFKPVENLSIGVGLDIMYSRLELKQFFPWSFLAPGLPLADGVSHFEGDGWGLGAYAGITWTIAPRHRFSLIGRLPLEIDYEGAFHVSEMPAFLEGSGFTSRSDFKSNIRFPGSIAAGYGFDVTDRLTIGVDFLWAFNSSHDDVPLDIDNNQALLGRTGLLTDWQDAITIGTGLQYRINDAWTVRAGYMYSEASQKDANYTPSVPSNDRHLITFGVGYQGEHHSLNLGYSYSYFPTRTVVGALEPAFDGEYEMGWHVLAASYSYRF